MIVGNRGTPLLRGTKPIGYNSAYVAKPQHLILRYTDGVIPDFEEFRWPATGTQISVLPNIWDVYVPSTLWTSLLRKQYELLEVIDANFENVTKADDICENCTKLTAIHFSNTDKVLDMSWMFWECESLTSVPLFDTSNVTDMAGMFDGCTSLTSVPLFDTSNVENMRSMFLVCSSLTSVPLFDTSKVTNMGAMFYYCQSLTSVPLFDTSNVTNMAWLFRECRSLTSVPLFDTSNVTDMGYMFDYCTSLTSVPLFDTSKVINMDIMLSNCTNVQTGALALYQQASTQTNPPSRHDETFRNCGTNTQTGSAELAQIPSSWK